MLECVGGTSTSASKSNSGSHRSSHQHLNYQTPASALYAATEDPRVQAASAGRYGNDI